MRVIILGVCVCAAACTGQAPTSPTSATSASRTSAVVQAPGGTTLTEAQGAAALPFHGSYMIETRGTVNPPVLVVNGVASGTATHLGQFTAVAVDTVDIPTTTSTGTFNLTAANGDQIFSRTSGSEESFTPPNISHIRVDAIIVGGTGRFAGASGTFTIRQSAAIDFAAGTSSGSGKFEGHLNLGK